MPIMLLGSLRPDSSAGRVKEMRKRKKDSVKLPKKTYWHLYSLQNLESEKFVKVVNKILRKEYMLIK